MAHTDELLDSMERAEADLASTQPAVAGTVRLAVFQTAVLSLIPSVLRELRQDYPHLRVEMVQHEPETALHETWARDFDLVVAEQYPGHAAPHYAALDRKILAHDAIRLALPASEDDHARGVPPRDLHRGRCGPALGHGTARRRLPALGRAGVPHGGLRTGRAL